MIALTSAPMSSSLVEALSHSPFPAVAVDIDHLTVVGADVRVYEILGRPPDSLEGLPVTDLVRASDLPAVEAGLRMLASGAVDGYLASIHR